MSPPDDGGGHYIGMDYPADLSNKLGALNLEMYPPQPSMPHTPAAPSGPGTPASTYPAIQPRQDQTPYQDYGQHVYYTPAPNSALPLESPFTPAPSQVGFGYASSTPLDAGPGSAGFDNGYGPSLIPNGPADGSLYGLGLGLGNDTRGGFGQQPRGSFRPPQQATDTAYYGYQQQDGRQYYGYQPSQQDRPYWTTPQGVFVQRELKKEHARPQFSAPTNNVPPTPLRYNPGPRSPTFTGSQYHGSPLHRSFPQSPTAGALTLGSNRHWTVHSPHTPSFPNPQSPTQYGMHFPQETYPSWNPYAQMGYPYGSRSPRRALPGLARSAILEDFRLNKVNKKWDISDIFGHIVEFAGDQHGSRFIQQRLEVATIEDRQSIFDEIMPNAYALMTDVFGNYVTQKMFEHGDQLQKAALGKEMEGKILNLSLQMYGCRVVQKAFEHLLLDQRDRLVSELDGHVVDCVKSSNANHVVQRVVVLGPPRFVMDAFIGHVEELSCHPYGCRVLQKTFECLPEKDKRELLDELHRCISRLIEDQFGNYVVQSIITSCDPADQAKVFAQLRPRIMQFCRHKFASNVIEKALQHGEPLEREALINALLGDGSIERIATLLRDPFGNFPVQTALMYAQEDQKQRLYDICARILPTIRATPVGKRLEIRFNEMADQGFRAGTESSTVSARDQDDSTSVGGTARGGHVRGSSAGTAATEMSRSNSSSTQVTSPERVTPGSLRPTASAPPGSIHGDRVSDAAKALHDLLH